MSENTDSPVLITRALERNVIACALHHPDYLDAVQLPASAFETDALRVAYSLIDELRRAGNDVVTLATLRTFYDQRSDFHEVVTQHGGWQFLENLAARPDTDNFRLHLGEVVNRYRLREIQAAAKAAADAVNRNDVRSPQAALELVDSLLSAPNLVEETETFRADELGSGWLESQIAAYEAGEFKNCGIPVNNPYLRYVLGDILIHGSMITLTAETNIGKSMWFQTIVRHFTLPMGIPTLVLDNELSSREFRNRTISNLTGVRFKLLMNGSVFDPTHPEHSILREGLTAMETAKIVWRRKLDMTRDSVEAEVRRFVRQFPKDQYPHKIIIVDGIKMQSGNESFTDVGFFAQGLKQIAQTYEHEGVVMMPSCQLNRSGTARSLARDKEAHPDHNSIGLSKMIADNSDDVLILMKHPEIDGSGNKSYSKHHRRLICTKARNHPTFDGSNYVLFDFDGQRCFLEPASLGGIDSVSMPSVIVLDESGNPKENPQKSVEL